MELERFFKEEKGAFVRGELCFEPGLHPRDIKDSLMPIANAINEITKDQLRDGGVYQVSGGLERVRKALLTGLETKYQGLLSVPQPPPIPDPAPPPPSEPTPSAGVSGVTATSEEASESWLKRLSKEKWVGKKGLAVVGGTVALGAAVCGLSHLLRDKSPQEGQQAR